MDEQPPMQRYRGIIDDWDAFVEACGQPALTTIRHNTLKAADDFEERLRALFPTVERTEWNPDIYRLGREEKPGKSLLHWRGEYYVQEESATIPVTVLDPQPGERVLDMCAAPGGKTTQIAAHMDNRGLVLANEKSGKRMRSLHANVNRMGAAIVATSHYDGRNMPAESFDRILVDAPCSGEGNNCRKHGYAAQENERDSLSTVQRGLLEKAAEMLAPGGTLVYSTCTFAPEENEAVITHALEHTDMEIAPIDIDVPHQNGIKEFQGQTYDERVEQAVRVFPHHLGSGGMFIARFRN